MTRRKRTPPDEWARLSVRWYTDPVLRAAAKQAPAALAMFPVLLAKAKASSHVTKNPAGSIKITLEDLAAHCCCTKGRATKALEALVDGELVTMDAERLGILRLTLPAFGEWQTPRGSKQEQDEHRADRIRSEVGSTSNGTRLDIEPASNGTQSRDVHDQSPTDFAGKTPPITGVNAGSNRGLTGPDIEVDIEGEGGTREPTIPVELEATLQVACSIVASPAERGMWLDNLLLHRMQNPQVAPEMYFEAIQRTKAWADSQLGGKFVFHRAWSSFLKDLRIVKVDAVKFGVPMSGQSGGDDSDVQARIAAEIAAMQDGAA